MKTMPCWAALSRRWLPGSVWRAGLHVIADVTGFGQAGGVTDGEGDVQVGSQGLDQMGLPAARGPISRMLVFSIRTLRKSGSAMIGSGASSIPGIDETLVVIGDAQGEPPLGDVLPDNILVEVGDQGLGGRDRGEDVPHARGA